VAHEWGSRLADCTFENFCHNKEVVWPSLQLTVMCSTVLADIITRSRNTEPAHHQHCMSLLLAKSNAISCHILFQDVEVLFCDNTAKPGRARPKLAMGWTGPGNGLEYAGWGENFRPYTSLPFSNWKKADQ